MLTQKTERKSLNLTWTLDAHAVGRDSQKQPLLDQDTSELLSGFPGQKRHAMAAPRKRVGLPKPDRRRPGQWLPITREEEPEAFRTPEEQREADAACEASVARLQAIREGESAALLAAVEGAGSESESEREISEPESEEDSTYEPTPTKRKGKGKAPQTEEADEEADLDEEIDDTAIENASDVPADALEVDKGGWKVNQPKSQPLTYAVPIDDDGEKKYKTIKFTVDFTSRESVEKANKRRHLARGRARKSIGLPPLRPSTQDRKFTQANLDWIDGEHDLYAADNDGARIPVHELTTRYNAQFPSENRTQASLTSIIDRKRDLKAKRASYE